MLDCVAFSSVRSGEEYPWLRHSYVGLVWSGLVWVVLSWTGLGLCLPGLGYLALALNYLNFVTLCLLFTYIKLD